MAVGAGDKVDVGLGANVDDFLRAMQRAASELKGFEAAVSAAKDKTDSLERSTRQGGQAAQETAQLMQRIQQALTASTQSAAQNRIDAIKREAAESEKAISASVGTRTEKIRALTALAQLTESQITSIEQAESARRTAIANQEAAARATALQRTNAAAQGTAGSLGQVTTQADKAGSALAMIGQAGMAIMGVKMLIDGMVGALHGLFQTLVGSNANLENLNIGMAAVINASLKIQDANGRILSGKEKFNAAQKMSNDLIEQFRIDQIKTVNTSTEKHGCRSPPDPAEDRCLRSQRTACRPRPDHVATVPKTEPDDAGTGEDQTRRQSSVRRPH